MFWQSCTHSAHHRLVAHRNRILWTKVSAVMLVACGCTSPGHRFMSPSMNTCGLCTAYPNNFSLYSTSSSLSWKWPPFFIFKMTCKRNTQKYPARSIHSQLIWALMKTYGKHVSTHSLESGNLLVVSILLRIIGDQLHSGCIPAKWMDIYISHIWPCSLKVNRNTFHIAAQNNHNSL